MGLIFSLRRCDAVRWAALRIICCPGAGLRGWHQHYYDHPLQAPDYRWEQGDEAHAHVERLICIGGLSGEYTDDCRSRFLLVIGGGLSNFTAIPTQLAESTAAPSPPVVRAPRIEACAAWGCRWMLLAFQPPHPNAISRHRVRFPNDVKPLANRQRIFFQETEWCRKYGENPY